MPPDLRKIQMSKIAAIIGGGVIGGGWAARFLLNGWDVRVFDPDPEAERKIGEVWTMRAAPCRGSAMWRCRMRAA